MVGAWKVDLALELQAGEQPDANTMSLWPSLPAPGATSKLPEGLQLQGPWLCPLSGADTLGAEAWWSTQGTGLAIEKRPGHQLSPPGPAVPYR